jgi:hypothetical protein
MTAKAMLLLITLAHGGYWFGGNAGTITVNWAAPDAHMPAATLSWQLMYQTVAVASGQADIPGGANARSTAITLQLPEARALAGYTWKYQLKNAATGAELESGERIIYLCPLHLLSSQAKHTKGKAIVVIDGQDQGIFQRLKDEGVQATRVAAAGDLELQQPDIIFVAEDQLPENAAVQNTLRAKAMAGSSVMVFAQQKIKQSLGFPLTQRPIKNDLAWKPNHELFENLPAAQLNAWAREHATGIKALALTADAPVLELGYWPRESPGDKPAPIDAVAATQTLGAGRIVWWQIPTGGFQKDDPRPQILLANALDYLLTRPEPTLPPSQRTPRKTPQIVTPNAANIIVGEKP